MRFCIANLFSPNNWIDLAVDQSWKIYGKGRHQVICCIRGSVWVTQEGDIHDYILEKGDAFQIMLPGLVMVRAFETSRIGYIESMAPIPFFGPFCQTVFK